jgi:GDP-4-dehydro-6-deoxy-D-mannose reductase
MKALVTGASGFVGTHLLRLLQAQGIEVATHGPEPAILGKYYDSPIEDISRLTEIVSEIRPDYVFHLAGIANGEDYSLYYRVNVQYAANLLRALELAGLADRPVLLTGTAAEYGLVPQEEQPITEKTPTLPYNHYGASKLAQTHLGIILANTGRRIVLVRPFNIIGPGMGAHLAVQAFALQIASITRGEQPPVIEVGNLSSSRDFVDVGEVVRIYWDLIRTPAAYSRVVNVCSGLPVKMNEILTRLIQISGLNIEVHVSPERFKALDVPMSYGDPSLLKTLIGTYPKRKLADTLRDILASLIPLPA